MDEIHVKSHISDKGGKYCSNLDLDNPTKTVFAIMVSSLYEKWSSIVRLLPCASVTAENLFETIKSCIRDVEECCLFVQAISTDNYPLNVKLFKKNSPIGKLDAKVPHPCDIDRNLFLTFDFVHILESVRNNLLNQQSDRKLFSYPDLNCISIDQSTYQFKICHASFRDIRMLYNSERDSLAKLAPRLTAKSCYPSSLERQNVKLVLKVHVVHESTIAGFAIQNEQRSPAFKSNTSDFVGILLSLWKIFNVNIPYKHVRLNDPMSKPLTFNDERFIFLTRIVYWLDAWQSLPEKGGKLSKQVLPQITNFLTETCGYSYLLTSFLQTDPLEHLFGLYRMMSVTNYHVSYLQILESERRLKVSNILSMFSSQPVPSTSFQEFIQSFSSLESADSINDFDLDPFLHAISDLSAIECNILVLQSLTFIAGYSVYQ